MMRRQRCAVTILCLWVTQEVLKCTPTTNIAISRHEEILSIRKETLEDIYQSPLDSSSSIIKMSSYSYWTLFLTKSPVCIRKTLRNKIFKVPCTAHGMSSSSFHDWWIAFVLIIDYHLDWESVTQLGKMESYFAPLAKAYLRNLRSKPKKVIMNCNPSLEPPQ